MRAPYAAVPLVAVCLCAGAGPKAQGAGPEEARRPTFARVVDPLGAPVAGAVVTFAGCLPHLGTAGPTDLQVVASDGRGRAQAKLQPGLCYVAWAVAPADQQGGGVRSVVQGYFGAGALVDLRCEAPYRPRPLQLSGAEAWADRGPLRYFAQTSIPGTEEEIAPVDGVLTVPAGPMPSVEVRTADGQPLWHTPASGTRMAIPPPQTVRVRVVDENGAPLPGAVVRQRVGRRLAWGFDGFGGVGEDRHRDLGAVGADGTAALEVCYPADPLKDLSNGELLLFASAPGRPPVAGGIFNHAFYEDDRKVAGPPLEVLRFTCKRVEPLVGDCGRVPVGTVAHLAAVCKLFSQNDGYLHDARAFVVPVGPDGRFCFEDVPAELHACRLTLLPPPGSDRRLPLFPAIQGRALPPEVASHAGAGQDHGATADLQLQVKDPTAGPARGVIAFLVPAELRGVLFRDSMVRFPLDARGCAQLRLAPGRWVVLAMSSTGYAAKAMDLTPAEHRVDLAMEPLACMHVRLCDENGAPVAGAKVLARGTSTRGSGDPLESLLQSLNAKQRAEWSDLATDADGRVTILFVPVRGLTRRLALQWEGRSTADFALEANEVALELRPR